MSDPRAEQARQLAEQLCQRWFDAGARASWCPTMVDEFAAALAAARAEGQGQQAIESIRDAVLNGRGPLAEMDIDNDITNAVLGIIDDYTPEQPAPPAGALVWTEQKPTEPGFYWYRLDADDTNHCVVEVFKIGTELHGEWANDTVDDIKKDNGEWSSGPLAPPRDTGEWQP